MKGNRFQSVGAALLVLSPFLAPAITPEQLQKRMDQGESFTLIDVRPTVLYQDAHIPNSINVPATLIPQKQWPRLHHVVVYDSGLGSSGASNAVAALAAKGISAEILEGGFAGWDQASRQSTKIGGLRHEELPMISYAQLKQAPAVDTVLVDLRHPKRQQDSPDKTSNPVANAPFTDLSSEFPGAQVTSSPFEFGGQKRAATGSQPLLVLIDNGDGAAEAMARALKANGIERFAILAGGETILARKGASGLQRLGKTITPRSQQTATPPASNH